MVTRTRRPRSSGVVEPLDDPGREQRPVDGDGPPDVAALRGPRLVVVGEQPLHRAAPVAVAVEHVQEHRVRHGEARRERLGLGAPPGARRSASPHDTKPVRRLASHDLAALLRVVAGLGQRPARSRRRARAPAPPPCRPMSYPARPARPAIWWNSRALRWRVLVPSYFDRAVKSTVRIGTLMPDAERVGAADDLEQPGLGQALDQPPVLREHPGVVDADAVAHEPRQRLAEPGREAEVADELGDAVLLLAGRTR